MYNKANLPKYKTEIKYIVRGYFMHNKIIVSADRTCDLTQEIIQKHNIQLMPFYVNFEDKSCVGDEEITPAEIFEEFDKYGKIAKTAAKGVGDYTEFFKKFIDKGQKVIHITISSELSCAYQNCIAAKQELGDDLQIIDSRSLSTGVGLIVLEAAKRAESGMEINQIVEEVTALVNNVRASFIIENLSFLRAGGRCSSLAAIGANLLSLKPSIVVENGAMSVGKKYRGVWKKSVLEYVKETLDKYTAFEKGIAFITHSGVSQDIINSVYKCVKSKKIFKEIVITQAESVISCHCGPNVIGVLFVAS